MGGAGQWEAILTRQVPTQHKHHANGGEHTISSQLSTMPGMCEVAWIDKGNACSRVTEGAERMRCTCTHTCRPAQVCCFIDTYMW